MSERLSYTPKEVKAMGYDLDVVRFFEEKDPDLLSFMWGNGSAHYSAILKNEIDSNRLISTANMQIQLEHRVGNVAASSLLMAEFRLSHPQAPVSTKKR